VLVGLIVLAGLANLTPSLVYWGRHGPNQERAGRMPAEAEIYGLRIAQLLLPVTHHRLAWLAHLKERYNRAALLVNENDSAALGLVGSLGFVLLLGRLLLRHEPDAQARETTVPLLARRANRASPLWQGLSLLNLGAVLLAVRGGLGGLVAMRLTWIRGYNRISVFIGFFALFAVVLGLEALRRRYARSARGNAAYLGLLGLLLCGGLLDQAPHGCIVPAARVRPAFAHDAAFLQRVEASVPAQSMIFQLPYAAFPEQGAVEAMGDYELLRACLHSRTLRWSHGAMRGREADAWQRAVAGQPPPELVRTLIQAGFGGIYVDRFGYRDRAVKLEKALTGLIGREPLVSGNGRLAFFSLSPLGFALRSHGLQR
jgi:phosphoglycerol transferase